MPTEPQFATVCPLQMLQNKIDLIENLKGKINYINAALAYAEAQTGTFRIAGHKQNSNNSTSYFTASSAIRDALLCAIREELSTLIAQHDAEVEKLAAIQKLWS